MGSGVCVLGVLGESRASELPQLGAVVGGMRVFSVHVTFIRRAYVYVWRSVVASRWAQEAVSSQVLLGPGHQRGLGVAGQGQCATAGL